MLNKQNKLGTDKICLSSKDEEGKRTKQNSILELMEHKEDRERKKVRLKDFQPQEIRTTTNQA